MRDVKKAIKQFHDAEKEVLRLKGAVEKTEARLAAARKAAEQANTERMRLATEAASGAEVEGKLQAAREAYRAAQDEAEELKVALEHMQGLLEQAKRQLFVAELRARKALEAYWRTVRDEHMQAARKAATKHLQEAMRAELFARRMDPKDGHFASPGAAMRNIEAKLNEYFQTAEMGRGVDFTPPASLYLERSGAFDPGDWHRLDGEYDLHEEAATA